jgi:transcriptional regulator GlxA family with amidase domain
MRSILASRRKVHSIVVLALDGVVAADAAAPAEVFARTRLSDGGAPYQVSIATETASVDAGLFTLETPWRLDALTRADTVIVPGRHDLGAATPPAAIDALRAAAANGRRIASICVGAFILAEAGLLDGKRATTHWAAAAELARRFPAVEVDPDVLYVDNGQILTSAGAAAAFDLCLHLVRCDHSPAVAADTARAVVMPLERAGGQRQYIKHPVPPPGEGQSLEPLLRWLHDNASQPLTLEAIAAHAAMSTRSLNRHFRDQVGTTPMQWLRTVRVRRAQHLLEATDHTIERIARLAGFPSATALRQYFTAVVGTNPTTYRRTFKAPDKPVATRSSTNRHRNSAT